MIIDEDSIDFKKYFVVDQSSPTGLRWRDDVKRLEEGKVGGNSWGGTQAGYHKQAKGRVKTTVVSLNKKVYVVSRIIWNMLYGKIPDGMIVDHLDGNPWNNTPSNLACKTRAENIRNCARRKDNSSGFVGVSFIVKGASTYCVSTYQDENGKRKRIRVNVKSLGLLPAFQKAIEFRLDGIKKMNDEFNFKYTNRHVGMAI